MQTDRERQEMMSKARFLARRLSCSSVLTMSAHNGEEEDGVRLLVRGIQSALERILLRSLHLHVSRVHEADAVVELCRAAGIIHPCLLLIQRPTADGVCCNTRANRAKAIMSNSNSTAKTQQRCAVMSRVRLSGASSLSMMSATMSFRFIEIELCAQPHCSSARRIALASDRHCRATNSRSRGAKRQLPARCSSASMPSSSASWYSSSCVRRELRRQELGVSSAWHIRSCCACRRGFSCP